MCYNVNKICKHSPPLSKKLPGKGTSKAKQNKRKKTSEAHEMYTVSCSSQWLMIEK